MRPFFTLLALTALVLAWPGALHAQGDRLIKVAVEFHQSGTESKDAMQGSGRLVITDKGSARSSGRLSAEGRETRVRQSTGLFTLVRDGGEATLTVATQVPYPQVAFYQDYARGAGYLASGVAFKDVGTALKVRASVLSGNRIQVRLTPMISHFSSDGSGTIEFTEASTELVVESGRAVILGGGTTQLHEVTRQILGFSERQAGQETAVLLTATVLK